jgi:hypothetical protein
MIPLLAAAVIALASSPPDPPTPESPVDQRISSSSQAAEALQGELDGAWDLTDLEGRKLYALQIVDPPGPRPHLEAAWRRLTGPPSIDASGPADIAQPTASVLRLSFSQGGSAVRIDLRRNRAGEWSGRLIEQGRVLRVTLRRSAA